jgi:hypothetical protein
MEPTNKHLGGVVKVQREVKIEADDRKAGMTSLELRRACEAVPHQLVPTVEITMGGRIKAIKFKVTVDTE